MHVIGHLPPWRPDGETSLPRVSSPAQEEVTPLSVNCKRQESNKTEDKQRWGACHKSAGGNGLLRSLFVDRLQRELAVYLPQLWGVFWAKTPQIRHVSWGPQELTSVRDSISIIGHTRDLEVSNYHL